jgi:hypothetical protein
MPDTDPSTNGTRTRDSIAPVYVGKLHGASGLRSLTLERPASPLQAVYALSKAGAVQAALREVLRLVDGHLRVGDFAGCNRLFGQIDLDRLDPETATGFLAYTRIVEQGRLKNRSDYVRTVRAWLRVAGLSAAQIDDLLHGIE